MGLPVCSALSLALVLAGCIHEPQPPSSDEPVVTDDTSSSTTPPIEDTGPFYGWLEIENAGADCPVAVAICHFDTGFCDLGATSMGCKVLPGEVETRRLDPGTHGYYLWGEDPFPCAFTEFTIRAGETNHWSFTELYDCGVPPMFSW